MASAKTSAARPSKLNLVAIVRRFVAQKVSYRRTFRTLSVLTDRDLHDIGITRSDIPLIARTYA
jgi:uncharacterized protein YjiS (DUF1127 family)